MLPAMFSRENMKKTGFFLSAAALKFLAFCLASLSWGSSRRLGASIGRLCTFIIRKRFRLTQDNILKALPGTSPEQARDIAARSWENMGIVAAEVAQTSRMTKDEILSRCRWVNEDRLKTHLATGKGALMHVGHIANWELVGLSFHAAGYDSAEVVRHIRNPYVDEFILSIRGRFGGDIIGHRAPFFGCAKALKKGRVVGILMDQNMPAGEVYTPFLGRMASTTPLTALLSLKTGCPIFPVHVKRDGENLNIVIEPPIQPASAYSEEEVYRLIGRLNERLESWIKEDPAQWLWAHNRWKREKDALAYMERHAKEAVAESRIP